MTEVYLGIGSNIEPEENLRFAIRELRRRFGELDLSPVYESRPLGFDGEDFFNMVVRLQTELTPADVIDQLEEIHAIAGRVRDSSRYISRVLDIDLLLYDGLVVNEGRLHIPRSDVLDYSFVLRPLAELAPEFVHPVTGRRIADHWQEFDRASHPLKGVSVSL